MHSTISFCKEALATTRRIGIVRIIIMIGILAPLTASAAITNLVLTSPLGGQDWRGVHDITWTKTDNDGLGGPISILLSADGGTNFNTLVSGVPVGSMSHAWNTTSIPDGSMYKIKIVDPASSISFQSTSNFTIDNTAPVLSAVTLVAASTNDTTPNYTFTTNEAGTITYSGGCSSAATAATVGNNTITFNELADGTYSACTITVTDDADEGGNSSLPLEVAPFVVDTVAPMVDAGSDKNVNVSVLQNATTTDAAPSSGIASYAWTKISGPGTIAFNSATLEDVTISADIDGVYVLRLTATDAAGNSSFDDITFTWDTTAPSAFITDSVQTTGGALASGWWNSTNTGVDITIPVGSDTTLTGGMIQVLAEGDTTFENLGAPYIILSSDLGNNKILSVTAAEFEALSGFGDADIITFNAIITDAAGNTTTGTVSGTTLTIDQTAPSVYAGTNKEVNVLAPQDATISDSGSGLSTYAWSKQTGVGTVLFSNPNGVAPMTDPDADISVTDMSPVGDDTYILALTVTDIAGNSAFGTSTFVWDTTAPVLSMVTPISSPTNDTTPSYTFNVDKAAWLAGNEGSFNTIGACGTLNDDVIDGNTTVTFNTLADNTYTDCDVTVTDKAGNTSSVLAINDFILDTSAATTNAAGITTEDVDQNGKIDRVTIVFDNAVEDATFVASSFMVGGVVPTIVSTGSVVDDNTIVLTMNVEVDGTNAKMVAFTTGDTTDLAGNTIASFSFMSTDIAKPVLLSARTVDTTHLTASFSEDIKGSTVNSSGSEFAVTGFPVSAASETAGGVVTLTVALMPTDATPNVTFTNAGTFTDMATSSNEAVTGVTVTAVDGIAPVLTSVAISSNNAKNGSLWAKQDDTVTVAFTSSEPLHTNTSATINGSTAMIANVLGNNWTATRVMQGEDAEGVVTFALQFEDTAAPAHNVGTQITTTSNASGITYDKTAPLVNAGADREINMAVTQSSASASDEMAGSGLDFTSWSQLSGPGVVTFTTPATTQATIVASAQGVHTLRLTAEDEAGNTAFDDIVLTFDTTASILEFIHPAHLSTSVSVADDTLRAYFRQLNGVEYDHITLLNADGVFLENQDDGANVQGVALVQGGDGASNILEVPYAGLAHGTTYCLSILAGALRDTAGNTLLQDIDGRCFTTIEDTTAPYIESLTATSIGATTATVTVITNEEAVCSISDDDRAFDAMNTLATTDSFTHTADISGIEEQTTYNRYVRCEDGRGNVMTNSGHVSFTTTMLDTIAPPTPFIVTPEATVNADTYVISGTAGADTPVDGVREVTIYNGSSVAGTSLLAFGQTSWSITVLLTQNATSTFTAMSRDASGNESLVSNSVDIGDSDMLDVDTTVPSTPVITTSEATVDADTYTLAGTVALDATDTQVVYLYNGTTLAGSATVAPLDTVWSITTSLVQNTINSFTVTASDTSGNTSGASSAVVITEAETDTTAPAITAVTVSAVATTGATVNVTTNGNATCKVGLADVVYGSLPNVMTGGGTTVHSFIFTGLGPNVEYHAYVACSDAMNNMSGSSHQAFTTLIDNTTAVLGVTGMSAGKTFAATDNSFENGWKWTFYVTVPTAETSFAMKFADFMSGANTIAAADNIRYYSPQASVNSASTTAAMVVASNTYPENITLDSDLDAHTAGRQIAVTVEMKVPVGSIGGSYSASYGVKSE